ncbi:hypothetical protein CPB85DRAFT_1457132 [Mucidula mucida]|nr:hypothetical protein CPB85DRAFT_1457132 [Mucidula mucida]
MRLTGFKPMYPGAPVSPSIFIEEAPEVRAAYVDWDSPAVMEDIYGKPKLTFKQSVASLKKQLQPITRPLVKKLQPITRPFTSPFASNPYPPDTDVPVVRAAKCVARLGRPKKLKLMKRQGCLDTYPLSPLIRNPTSVVAEECYTMKETRKGFFVEKKEKVKRIVPSRSF